MAVDCPDDELSALAHRIREHARLYVLHRWGAVHQHKKDFAAAVVEHSPEDGRPKDPSAYHAVLSDPSNKTTRVPTVPALKATVSFLTAMGYWPSLLHDKGPYPSLVHFFGGRELSEADIEAYRGAYCYYQHSTRTPGTIATSTLTISVASTYEKDKSDPCTFLETKERSSEPNYEEVFEGIFFINGEKKKIILLRERKTHGPKCLFVMDSFSPENQQPWLGGRLLKASDSRHMLWHQSNWFARRLESPPAPYSDRFYSELEIKERDDAAHKALFKTDYFRRA